MTENWAAAWIWWRWHFAEPLRSLFPDGGRGRDQISRRRFSRAAAGRVRALRGHRHADPARRAEILERRSAGGLHLARGRAAAPFPGPGQTVGRVLTNQNSA